LALRHGLLPPTINVTTADPDCDLGYVANEARRERIEIAASNSSGFGGHTTSVVFRRWAVHLTPSMRRWSRASLPGRL